MARIPKKPEDIFTEFTADYHNAFQKDLESVILFGSGARSEYIPGKSDLNFMIILSEQGMERLDELSALVAKWHKKKVAVPLFMTKTALCSSVDSYPIEFLNMQRHYRKIFGEDVLAGLQFDSAYIRLQCERELKGKSLLLMQRFMETQGDERRIRGLISDSITAFLSIFRALLYLKEEEIPENRREVVRAAVRHYGIDLEIFTHCIDIKEGILSFTKQQVKEIFFGYLKEIRRLTDLVDHWTEKSCT